MLMVILLLRRHSRTLTVEWDIILGILESIDPERERSESTGELIAKEIDLILDTVEGLASFFSSQSLLLRFLSCFSCSPCSCAFFVCLVSCVLMFVLVFVAPCSVPPVPIYA